MLGALICSVSSIRYPLFSKWILLDIHGFFRYYVRRSLHITPWRNFHVEIHDTSEKLLLFDVDDHCSKQF